MNIDHLIKMANEISSFWEGELGADKAANEVATHLRRYWEPRMRAQIIRYFEEHQGAGLSDVAKQAIAVLASQTQAAAAPAAGPAAQTVVAGPPVSAHQAVPLKP